MVILVHYGELALKGANRPFFERLLRENISKVFSFGGCKFKNIGGGLLITGFNGSEEDAEKDLSKIFGIANFSFVIPVASDISAISESLWRGVKDKKFASFKIETRRADKDLSFDSSDVNKAVGEFIRIKSGAKVDLENPELTCFVEIFRKESYLYFEKFPGAGGLPVGSGGRVLVLLSSGIDSPVAAWRMLKRGCDVDFIHFHGYPQTSRETLENVKELTGVLKMWGAKGRLFLAPFLEIQKELFKKLSEGEEGEKEYLVLLYRYFMLRIAEMKAEEIGAQALVTGDNLGQVASQTVPNLIALDKAVRMSIFRPLLGFDKKEIIVCAREIGTYEISIRPGDDCCTLFVPRHPKISASFSDIQKLAKKIKSASLKRIYNSIEVRDV